MVLGEEEKEGERKVTVASVSLFERKTKISFFSLCFLVSGDAGFARG